MTSRSYRLLPTDSTTFYPRLVGTRGAVAANSYLSVNAAVDVLKAGGNAIDAACAATFVEGVVNPQMHGIGGECPILLRQAGEHRVVAINGNTVAPARATPEAFAARGLRDVPEEGVLAASAPAAFSALLTALERYGTMSFAEVVAPALQLAREGFAVSAGLRNQHKYGLAALEDRLRGDWPASAAVYLPQARLPEVGQRLRNQALARTYDWLSSVERNAPGGGGAKLAAVHDAFYKGEVASEIAKWSRARDGLLERGDMERFASVIEEPAAFEFAGATIFKCGFWSQGPAMLQSLAILEHFDLAALGHGSADYLHLVVETIKLAFADREQYYGDPACTEVPGAALLSREYARARAALIDLRRANRELRPGDPRRGGALLPADERLIPRPWGPGTVHVDVVDRAGNLASFTPSGGWLKNNEVIPALGFPLSCRMMTFYLGPAHHPNVVAPGKRPRTTLTPSLAFRDGRPWMAFGSMGGDQQEQWLLQFVLNRVVFGMTLQEAIEAPKLSSDHFPGFFAPHDRFENRVRAEPRIGAGTLEELRRRGHDVVVAPDWSEGFVSAAELHADSRLEAGCDPRGSKSETFPAYAYVW